MPIEEQERRRKLARLKWYEGNKEIILARQREYQRTLAPERKKIIQERYRAKHKDREKLRGRLKNWKHLPIPTRAEPELCECCGQKDLKKALSLDHCHASGIFRGWLCSKCNLGIGKLGDSIASIERALEYLKRSYQ